MAPLNLSASGAAAVLAAVLAALAWKVLPEMYLDATRFEPVGAAVPALAAEDLFLRTTDTRVLCVGCTRGLGEAIAYALLDKGAIVTVVGRSPVSARLYGRVKYIRADLSSLRRAARLAQDAADWGDRYQTVVLAAGVTAAGSAREATGEGVERSLAVSYLSRVALLDRMLARLDRLREQPPRVFVLGAPGTLGAALVEDLDFERSPFDPAQAQLNAVLGNQVMVHKLAEKHVDAVRLYGLNPGLIATGIRANQTSPLSALGLAKEAIIQLLAPSADDYALVVRNLIASPALEDMSGQSFNARGEPIRASPLMRDVDAVNKLWVKSSQLVKKALGGDGAAEAGL